MPAASTATQLATRPQQQPAPRRAPTGISLKKAEQLARSAKASGSRAGKALLRQKAMVVSVPSAAAFGAVEGKLPDMVGLGIPGGKRLVVGGVVAIAGAFMGGSMGETAMLVGLGPLCAGAADFGASVTSSLLGGGDGDGGDVSSVAGIDSVAGLDDIAAVGGDDSDRYRGI